MTDDRDRAPHDPNGETGELGTPPAARPEGAAPDATPRAEQSDAAGAPDAGRAAAVGSSGEASTAPAEGVEVDVPGPDATAAANRKTAAQPTGAELPAEVTGAEISDEAAGAGTPAESARAEPESAPTSAERPKPQKAVGKRAAQAAGERSLERTADASQAAAGETEPAASAAAGGASAGESGPALRTPDKAARPVSPLGDDEALITDESEAPPARPKASAAARPEKRGEKAAAPADVPHEPASPLERALAEALATFDISFRAPPVGTGDPVIVVPAEHLVAIARTLKDDPRFALDYPRCISGVDLIEQREVVYHLYSVPRGHQVWLKVRVAPDNPAVPSVAGVWQGADWHEREAAELVGIAFSGHPFLKLPFLLDDGFEGHPLLKSFELEPELSNVHPH